MLGGKPAGASGRPCYREAPSATHYNSVMNIAPVKPVIPPEVLQQVDIRVGTIEEVLDVPGADLLVQLRVNFGDHHRAVVAGLKQERRDPQEIRGKQALIVVNLQPRK